MAFELFEFVEKIMIDNFFVKIETIWKSGSIDKTFISLRIW